MVTSSELYERMFKAHFRNRPLFFRVQYQFLYPPVQQFTDVDFIFRRAGDFVNPAELLELLAGFAEHAENFSVEADLVNAARKGVRRVENLVWRRSDTNCPGR